MNNEQPGCPYCGSGDIQPEGGYFDEQRQEQQTKSTVKTAASRSMLPNTCLMIVKRYSQKRHTMTYVHIGASVGRRIYHIYHKRYWMIGIKAGET